MATIVLSAVGAAVGGALGGTVAGLSSVAIGRAVGATLGKAIDQRLLGSGSDPVETGKVDRFRLTQVGDGTPVSQTYGRMRLGGQVIWTSDFQETATTTGGGKGSAPKPKTTTYSYSVSLAIAVCEGEIASIGRVWADGSEVAPDDLNMRVYVGSRDQAPDPLMEAIEGPGLVPAYRGTAYVVMEDLALEPFGNRVPQFSFEVVRPVQPGQAEYEEDLGQIVRGVAMMPGTGEYALATGEVYYSNGPGSQWAANINTPSGKSDFATSLQALSDELPGCDAASLIVSWFGDDLRCGACSIRPKVEQKEADGVGMPWTVSGLTRAAATPIERIEDRPIYGGTPADAAVVQAIRSMREAGRRVMFYPFILMEQLQGNVLPDPWTGDDGQPHLPWRGRITLSAAPGRDGSPDGSAGADAEVADFFGAASASDFQIGDGVVTYWGAPDDWGLRRFILHYAALCAAAGGVESFCIGSELRGLTQIRGAGGFPAVQALRALAAEVRALLGPAVKIGYAADWSEYFGYMPQDGSGDRYFHLDPLWADENIDFIGIDNYMPISDWRDGTEHADLKAGWSSLYDPEYLEANIEGGEGYDWFYHSAAAEASQIRTPIEDLAHGEPWIWRYKDLRNWWSQLHRERIAGVRQEDPTDWVPGSKPIWFTELGCAAVDKGTNEPNKFLDPKSSESSLPRFSNGQRDELIQISYLRAVLGHWARDENNPLSEIYGGRMIDLENAYVWAWDARPFPAFPNNSTQWSDGENYGTGHWLNGRAGARTLSSVVTEICNRAGVFAVDTSRLFGVVRGFVVDDVSDARAALQPLMLRYGFDAIERDGALVFVMRQGEIAADLDRAQFVETNELDGGLEQVRESEAEMTGRVRVRFIEAGADFDVVSEEAVLPDDATHSVATKDIALSMSRGEGRQVAERWLSEARVSREKIRFGLPPSAQTLGAGDVVRLPADGDEGAALYRIDRVEQGAFQLLEAVRVEPQIYLPSDATEQLPGHSGFVAPVPTLPLFMDLPLMTGDEIEHAPHLACTATPWPGSVAVYASATDDSYALEQIIAARSVIGITETPMNAAGPGRWETGEPLQVRLLSGVLESRDPDAILNGANLAAIGSGDNGDWELFQFQSAELVAPDTYQLSGRLRGQAGSDGVMPATWPSGSWFVLMNGVPSQIDLSSAQRRLERHYRIGPANRGYDDPAYVHKVEAFDGNGLRPYAPCHLRLDAEPGGDLHVNWIRRTRIDGDSWDLPEVPLGEESESYLVRVVDGETVLREVTVSQPQWVYPTAEQTGDGLPPAYRIEVAQVSARYGPGPFSGLTVGA